MNRKLTTYKKNPTFSEVDRRAFSEIITNLGRFKLRAAMRTAYWWLHNEGWRFSPYQAIERRVSGNFDSKHGTDTITRVNIDDMDVEGSNASHGVYYQASPVLSTRKVISSLGISYKDFTFVDFGSGKGRTLLIASEFPFKRVIGAEFGTELHECAERNIARYKPRKASKVESVRTDATKFALPNDNLVLYFFNPFNEIVLKQVMENILDSLKASPRRTLLVYRYLPDASLIRSADGFHLIRDWQRYRIYEWIA